MQLEQEPPPCAQVLCALTECQAQLKMVTVQRDMLAHYARQCSELDSDLCFGEAAAGRCPYRAHYGPADREICTACIVRNAQKLEQASLLWDEPWE